MHLSSAVQVRDPIHGTILLNPSELAMISHAACQRLRNIKQLGFTDHAFPGATHSRFVHSLGAMHMAGQMFEAIFPRDPDGPLGPAWDRTRQLLRLAVLLHDVGHPPLSHATERCMPLRGELGLGYFSQEEQARRASHEDYTALLILNSGLAEAIERHFGHLDISPKDVTHLINGRFPESRRALTVAGVDYEPLLRQIVSGELDADRMDYLQRDSFYTGVNYGKVDEQWLLANLAYHIEGNRAFLALGHRAIFAFEDFLLSRFHMFVSVYYHHTSIGFDTMLARFIEDDPGALAFPTDAEAYLAFDDVKFWSILRNSQNQWAERIVNRNLYRRVVELLVDASQADLVGIRNALDNAGVDYYTSRDEGVLSHYYGATDREHSIYVIDTTLGQVRPIESVSKVFERYAQPTPLTRIYCHPEQIQTARDALSGFVPGGQLRLAWAR